MLILLDYNNIYLVFEQDKLVDLGMGIAESRYDQEAILNWIKKHRNEYRARYPTRHLFLPNLTK